MSEKFFTELLSVYYLTERATELSFEEIWILSFLRRLGVLMENMKKRTISRCDANAE